MQQQEQKTKIAITVKIGENNFIRDVRDVTGVGELVCIINAYLGTQSSIEGIEEIDEEVNGFYAKTLSDDDIDAMAASFE